MKTKSQSKKLYFVLIAAFMIGCFVLSNATVTKAAGANYKNLGYFYVAKGQVQPYRDTTGSKIKVISAAGNKYKVSKNVITITCKKTGEIKYEINGQKKCFNIYIGGNNKDSKVGTKEYKMAKKVKWGGKNYNDFFVLAKTYMKKEKSSVMMLSMDDKETLNKWKKSNRGIKYGASVSDVHKKYPSWEDHIPYGGSECINAARYYDKKTGVCVLKGFVLDDESYVTKAIWYAYKPEILDLEY